MFNLIEEHGVERALEIWREKNERWVKDNPVVPMTKEQFLKQTHRKEVLQRGTIRV